MTTLTCGAQAVLRPGGPVQVPLRACCIATLLAAVREGDVLRCPRLFPAVAGPPHATELRDAA
jgi:hypothetical protein